MLGRIEPQIAACVSKVEVGKCTVTYSKRSQHLLRSFRSRSWKRTFITEANINFVLFPLTVKFGDIRFQNSIGGNLVIQINHYGWRSMWKIMSNVSEDGKMALEKEMTIRGDVEYCPSISKIDGCNSFCHIMIRLSTFSFVYFVEYVAYYVLTLLYYFCNVFN